MFPYVVCVLNVHGCLNVGAIMRSAHLSGCSKIVVFGRRKYDKRSAVGAFHWMEVERVEGMAKDLGKVGKEVLEDEDYELSADVFLEYMNKNGYRPVFVEQAEDSVVFTQDSVMTIVRDSSATPCFVFGNEQYGVPPNILALKPRFLHPAVSLELQQLGHLESFNVSSCASIVLYRVMECYSTFIEPKKSRPRNEIRAEQKAKNESIAEE
eukprot:TRINITY_DN12712_c0_g1_i1.p1 TRINITY_DN12712_c0_g1~~TRINITY_DN12712_c0_g1_i1.p1  ORF type:complete len:210 (+),score=40.38 TRINITY_DN12712_c0_g1_i1:38-667(+)